PKHATVLEGGRPKRYEYGETDHCCENFRLLDAWLEAEGRQRRGRVGNAEARLARSRDIVAAALERLRGNETVFLHASGSCGECDAARSGSGRAAAGGSNTCFSPWGAGGGARRGRRASSSLGGGGGAAGGSA